MMNIEMDDETFEASGETAKATRLVDYKSGSDSDENDVHSDVHLAHLAPLPASSSLKTVALCAAPPVVPTKPVEKTKPIDSTTKEIFYNAKYEDLFAPEVGPSNPFKNQQQRAVRNTLAGFVEAAHLNEFQFETQRRTFHSYGFAVDPSVGTPDPHSVIVKESVPLDELTDKTVFETTAKRKGDKRKKDKNDKPEDIEGFKGPWARYADEQQVSKPNSEEAEQLEEILAKREKRSKVVDDRPLEEKSILHIKDSVDYMGRNFLHIPQDVGVNLKSDSPPDKCFLPKALIHTWQGHTKGIATIKWFPKSAHLILSAGMDCRVKIWEVYKDRRCVRTYYGHRQAVRDVSFNNGGDQFLSAAYDRYLKLWDTETGECVSRFTSRKIPYCCKFNPDEDKQHLIVAGTSDKKIICWDTRSGEIVQEYDRHLGAVNSITFVDENRRFVTTSDDKSLRVWEWDIPVDMKYIADPTMHSMPAVSLSPNQKWLACQSMDNKVVIFSALNRFKMNRKKVFTGHMVAGYACGIDFSPDMSYLAGGDADGKCYVWNWKNTKLLKKWKAHDNVCIAALWHPHEPSKLATAGWDGNIKFWD